MKRIMMLSTGGTISCTATQEGLTPTLSADDVAAFVPQIGSLCDFSTRTIFSMDSSNIQPEEWKLIAREVYACLDEYDGVVILHGTDTMAYTASMLSFMLRGLHKPVVITGSQLPVADPQTDAKKNLYDAFLTAVEDIAGVFVVFDGKIIRGPRVTKVKTLSMDAFDSINAPLAGKVVDGRAVIAADARLHGGSRTVLDEAIDPNVFLLKMIPGTRPEIFDSILALGYRGLVIEGFGLGGVHSVRRNIVEKLQQLCEQGVAVLFTTQCLYEISDLSVYEVGRKAISTGIIPGRDMTSEAAVTKLMWVLGHTHDRREIARRMEESLCGEITEF